MLKWVRRIAIFLLLGAIVNVAVAWGCVIWLPIGKSAATTKGSMNWLASVPKGWPEHASFTRYQRFGLTEWAQGAQPPEGGDRMIRSLGQWVMEAGLPFRSMFLVRNQTYRWGQFPSSISARRPASIAEGLEIPAWVPWCGLNRYGRYLPTQIAWLGFAANTVAYGGVAWFAACIPVAIRRRTRSERGLCISCGYPRGTSPVCTECGEPLPSVVAK